MLDYRTRPPASPLSADDRRLIDEAVTAGRVTRCPTGAMATAVEWVWQPNPVEGGRLVQVGGPDLHWKARKRNSEAVQSNARTQAARNNAAVLAKAERRRALVLPMLLRGDRTNQIARELGLDIKTVRNDGHAMIADGRLPPDFRFPGRWG
jgi:DNA-binding CsgD family transcriptional regulator